MENKENLENLDRKKRRLLDGLIRNHYLKDKRLIKAFLEVPLEEFIHPENLGPVPLDNSKIYEDIPNLFYFLSEKNYRTISAPHMISIMLQGLALESSDDLLILGAKSGYIGALAHKLAPNGNILILEANSDIAKITKNNLTRLKYKNIEVIVKNPLEGMPEKGPWKKILVTGAITQERIRPLLKQLHPEEGVLYAPIGDDFIQVYTQILRVKDEFFGKRQLQVRFSPLMTQLELDELELITDFDEFDDFEVEIKDDPNRVEQTLNRIDKDIQIQFDEDPLDIHDFDLFEKLKSLFSNPIVNKEGIRLEKPPEAQKILTLILSIVKELKNEDDYVDIFEDLEKIDDYMAELKVLHGDHSLDIQKVEGLLNEIRSLNILRKELSKKHISDKTVVEEKIKVINKQVQCIKEIQDIIKQELKKL